MKNKTNIKKIRYILYILFFILTFSIYYILASPIFGIIEKNKNIIQADSKSLKNHVEYLVTTEKERNFKERNTLNNVAEYIYNHFQKSGCDTVKYQKYKVQGNEYKNVICNFKGKNDEKIIIGAHYDIDSDNVYKENTEINEYFAGADDNASGIAGILELATMIGKKTKILKNNLEIVAYTLEEMPSFGTNDMGSYIHAKSLFDNSEKIKYMISVEMIGFFTEEKIQKYPIGLLNLFYPSKGNYIAIIGQLFDFKIKELKSNMVKNSNIDIESLSSPSFVKGVSFSDHRNYWKLGYRAYMITDTSFLRYKYYHTVDDTIDKLDFEKMSEVVNGIYGIINN